MIDKDRVKFRLAVPDDVHQLADLRWRLKTDDATTFDSSERASFIAAFTESVSGNFHDGPFFHWIAEVAGHPVAVMSVGKVPKVPSPKSVAGYWGYLTNCYALPDYRNQGIGTLLLAVIKEWAIDQGYEFLAVWPSDRSYPFYERNGFRRTPDPLVLEIEHEE